YKTHQTPPQPQPPGSPTAGRYSSPASTPTPAPGGGGPKDPCNDLANDISRYRNELARRSDQFARDPGNLPLTRPPVPDPRYGYRSRTGEANAFRNMQRALRDALNNYNTSGCSDSIPDDSWDWATGPGLKP